MLTTLYLQGGMNMNIKYIGAALPLLSRATNDYFTFLPFV